MANVQEEKQNQKQLPGVLTCFCHKDGVCQVVWGREEDIRNLRDGPDGRKFDLLFSPSVSYC